jgi:voltage-gated potassium channel Kch
VTDAHRSLTPLLGELAASVGAELERLEAEGRLPAARGTALLKTGAAGSLSETEEKKPGDAFDASKTAEERMRAAFSLFDLDGSGAITCEELKSFLTNPDDGRPLGDAEVQAIIDEYDTNSDGMLQFDEFAALWTLKQQQRISSLVCDPEDGCDVDVDGRLSNAIVVCGYGEVGLRVGQALNSLPSRPAYIAVDRDPTRISAGVMNDAPVVYGDGASESLLKAAGVRNPSAIVITFASPSRCLESTSRLRDAFPDTKIYVRSARKQEANELTKAGATAVVVETTESAVRFARLLGAEEGASDDVLATVRRVSSAPSDAVDQWQAPYSRAELSDLAEEVGSTLDEVGELYQSFASLGLSDDAMASRAAVRDFLILTDDAPMDDETLARFMAPDEGGEYISFFEFVRLAVSLKATA